MRRHNHRLKRANRRGRKLRFRIPQDSPYYLFQKMRLPSSYDLTGYEVFLQNLYGLDHTLELPTFPATNRWEVHFKIQL